MEALVRLREVNKLDVKGLWKNLSARILSETKPGESLSLGLTGEDSLFLRFNDSKVRQATAVEQSFIELTFQKDKRQTQLLQELPGGDGG